MNIQGRDIPIVLLRPRHERKITKRERERIKAGILAVGLIEPFLVFPENDYYIILNGHQRYWILLEMGVETVPCIFAPQKEAFTSNRMVNRVSPFQEGRMIKKSLEELDEKTIASALGITHLAHRLKATLLKQLHPSVAAACHRVPYRRDLVAKLGGEAHRGLHTGVLARSPMTMSWWMPRFLSCKSRSVLAKPLEHQCSLATISPG